MILRILCLAACVLPMPVALAAAPQWGGNVTASSDNLLRGVSRSSNDPALSAQVEVQESSGWLASLWASTSRVRAIDSTSVELAGTLGYARPLNADWTLVGSFSHYESPWGYRAGFYRYDEFTADLHFRESLLLSVSFSPDVSRYSSTFGPVWHRNAWAYEATWQHELRPHLRTWAGLGYYDLSDLFGDGYWYGSLGLGWRQGHWQLDASYVVPDHYARRVSYPGSAGRRLLGALSYSF
jgi:uncharacterized protein (TIGR02001 family)